MAKTSYLEVMRKKHDFMISHIAKIKVANSPKSGFFLITDEGKAVATSKRIHSLRLINRNRIVYHKDMAKTSYLEVMRKKHDF